MASNLQNPIFQDEQKAREWLEARVWPTGPTCPHCGNAEHAKITALHGKVHRAGLYQCNEPKCREQFTVTVGTVFERSKVPLSKWLAALFLLTASKKGVSSHQIHRSLGVTYKTAWFMMHRLREALRAGGIAPMGGAGKFVEIDETVQGPLQGSPKRVSAGWQFRRIVLTLVERGGGARSFHVDGTTIGTLLPIIRVNVNRESHLMTDQASWYKSIGKEFASHGTVNHEIKEDSAETIEGLSPYGVDADGNWVFFGFKLADKKFVDLIADHYRLGATIIYLQAIAQEAEQRRLQKNPHVGDLEAKEKPSNPVALLDLVPNLDGTSALPTCVRSSGTPVEGQLSFDLVERLHTHMPTVIDEMKRRQQAHKQQH